MEERDILYELAIRSDNHLLYLLSRTPSWKYIASFATNNTFWHQRVEYMLGISLIFSPSIDWKRVYYNFLDMNVREDRYKIHYMFTDRVLSYVASVKIALKLGYSPTSQALVIACEGGYTQTIELLLNQSHVDPTYRNSFCLRAACKLGYTDIVNLLLNDKRASPASEDSYCLLIAVTDRWIDIVHLLLDDGRVHPSSYGNYMVELARHNGDDEIVRMLTQATSNSLA